MTAALTIPAVSAPSGRRSSWLLATLCLASVLGTSALVAILGTAVTTGTATAFLHAWWVCVACYLAAACAAAWLRFAAG